MKMKNLKVIGFGLMVLGMLFVNMPAQAQGFKNQNTEDMVQNPSFQSTSTMTPSGSVYSANPALNADGTAVYSAGQETNSTQRPGGGPRKADAFTPPTPVGDGVLPLMLCAMLFAGVIYLRRRKALSR
jgi:hypothetical protein